METTTAVVVGAAVVNIIACFVQVKTFLAWRDERTRNPPRDI